MFKEKFLFFVCFLLQVTLAASSYHAENDIGTILKSIGDAKTALEEAGVKKIIDLCDVYQTLGTLEENIYNINELQKLYKNHRKKNNNDKEFLENINGFHHGSDKEKEFIESATRSVAEIINFVPVYSEYQALTYDKNNNLIFDVRYNKQDKDHCLFQTCFPLWIKEQTTEAQGLLKQLKNASLVAHLEKNNSTNSLSSNKLYLIVLVSFGINFLCTAGGIYWIYKSKKTWINKTTIL